MDLTLVVGLTAVILLLAQEAYGRFVNRKTRVRRELARRPRVRIRETRGGDIRVTGRVVPRGDLLHGPISGRPCVAFLVIVDQMSGDDWVHLLEAQDARPFVVADQSGEALVDTAAPYVLDVLLDWEERTDRRLGEQAALVRSLIASQNIETSDWLGRPKTLRVKEGVLRPGETVSVAGTSARELGPEGERAALREPPERLVLRGTDEEPLFIGDSLEAVEG